MVGWGIVADLVVESICLYRYNYTKNRHLARLCLAGHSLVGESVKGGYHGKSIRQRKGLYNEK